MGKVEDCYDKKIDISDCLDENLTLNLLVRPSNIYAEKARLQTAQSNVTMSTTLEDEEENKKQSGATSQDEENTVDVRRTKERQIRFVVERVSLWRKLYNGVDMGNGETVRYSLEDSAGLVGISKKSLDDYLL